MGRIIYSDEQLKALRANPNVVKCGKSITYSRDFKIRAVKAYLEGQTPNMIFQKAGFNLAVIGKWRPDNAIRLWKKIYKAKGEGGFARDERGRSGGPKPKDGNSDDPEYLQTKIAYLEAENAFLKRLKTKTKT